MTDRLLELAKNPRARSLIESLGLPIPLPTPLERPSGPWTARPLADRAVVVGAAPGATLLSTLAAILAGAGADPLVVDESLTPLFRDAGESFGRPARPLTAIEASAKLPGLVFDAS